MFVVPDNVGGRYSVLTPVGLLPIAVANIDIEDLLDGAQFASYVYNEKNLTENDCYKYAAYRNILYNKGKRIELLASYEPSFRYFIEWYKQLFEKVKEKIIKEFSQRCQFYNRFTFDGAINSRRKKKYF